MKCKTIVFDYDGTLHETLYLYKPAFLKVYRYLEEYHGLPPREWNDEEIGKWLGIPSSEMWERFMPGLPPEEKKKCSRMIGREMIEQTGKKGGLYPGVEKTLDYLRDQGYNMIVLSNCKEKYMEKHRAEFKLDRFFSGYYPAQKYDYIPKWKIFNYIRRSYLGPFAVVGDRYQDIEVGKKNGLTSVGCNYGYGKKNELEKADHIIDLFPEMEKIF